MKSRINLFSAEFKPRLVLLSLNFGLVLWTLSLLGIVSAYVLIKDKEQTIALQAKQINEQHSQKLLLVTLLGEELEKRNKDQTLLTKLDEIQSEIRDKKAILAELSGREALTQKRFSALMGDLAATHQGDLWLKHVSVEQQDLLIEGAMSEASALPLWLSRLRSADYFAGQQFNNARVYRDEGQQLNFALNSGKESQLSKGQANE
jgi:Tfp pilus assembly protein PilN